MSLLVLTTSFTLLRQFIQLFECATVVNCWRNPCRVVELYLEKRHGVRLNRSARAYSVKGFEQF